MLRTTMSKALLLAIGLLAGAANAHAQQYLLRVSQDQNYQPLQNAQALTGNGWKHTQNTTLMLGFDFKYFGQTFNMVQENHNGVVSVDENGTNGFYAAKAQYDYRPKSMIRRVTDGTPNHYINKLEWLGAGFTGDATDSEYVNYQIWMYQDSNKIEFHYGNSYIKPGNIQKYYGGAGYPVALVSPDGSYKMYLKGDPADPEIVVNPAAPVYLDSLPDSGTVYTFTVNPNAGLGDAQDMSGLLSLYPNPAQEAFFLNWGGEKAFMSNAVLTISDLNGREVYNTRLTRQMEKGGQYHIPAGGLPSGIYMVKIAGAEGMAMKKLIVN